MCVILQVNFLQHGEHFGRVPATAEYDEETRGSAARSWARWWTMRREECEEAEREQGNGKQE